MSASSSSSSESSLRSVADGATLHYVGTLVVNVAGFLLNLVLTRTLGASVYGIYAYGTMALTSALTVANFGSDVSTTRYISGRPDDRQYQNRVLGLSYVTTLVVSVLTAAVLFVGAPTINAYTIEEPLFEPALRIFALALPFQALIYIVSSTFRGLEMAVGKTVVMVVGPTLQLVAIAVVVVLGSSVVGVAAAYAIASLMAFVLVFGYVLSRTELRPTWGLSRSEAVDFYNYSVPLTFSKACSVLFKRVDVFMIGIFLASADVGIYNVAVLLAGILAMPLSGINQLFPPVVSRLNATDDRDSLESVYATVTRWSITASILIALPIFVYREQVLALFGPEFVAGTTVVVFFIVAQLCNSAAGPANDLLTMTDHQYVVMTNHFGFGVLNVVLNYYFIQQFGLVGAALATAGVLASLNALRVVEVWYLEDLVPYKADLWKPLLAAGASAGVMYGVGLSLAGYPLMIVGSAAGVATFCICLYAFGLEEQDVELVDDYVEFLS